MWEEAEARAVDMALYRIFDVPHISQVYVFYRCEVLDGQFGAGSESLESALYSEADIPWDELRSPLSSRCSENFLRTEKPRSFRCVTARSEYQKRRTG